VIVALHAMRHANAVHMYSCMYMHMYSYIAGRPVGMWEKGAGVSNR
jgi:hypothetical protein